SGGTADSMMLQLPELSPSMRKRPSDWLREFGKSGCRRSTAVQLAVQPGAGVDPMPLGGSGGDAQRPGGFVDGQAGEVAKVDELRLERLLTFELLKGLVQGEEVVGRGLVGRGQQRARIELDPP